MVIIVVNSWTGNPVVYLSEEIGNNKKALQQAKCYSALIRRIFMYSNLQSDKILAGIDLILYLPLSVNIS